MDWLQIDVGFLTEQEKDTVLEGCSYAVVNGSHTVMGEIMGGKRRPIIGMPVYDEHTNNLRWAERKGLGILAKERARGRAAAVRRIRREAESFREALDVFAENFSGGRGAEHRRHNSRDAGTKEIMGGDAAAAHPACGSLDGRADRKG